MRKMEDEEFVLRLKVIIEHYGKLESDDFWVSDEITETLDLITQAKKA